jgi:hypothetical protein
MGNTTTASQRRWCGARMSTVMRQSLRGSVDLEPGAGLGPLRLGMTAAEVSALLGEGSRHARSRQRFHRNSLLIEYRARGVAFIEVSARGRDTATPNLAALRCRAQRTSPHSAAAQLRWKEVATTPDAIGQLLAPCSGLGSRPAATAPHAPARPRAARARVRRRAVRAQGAARTSQRAQRRRRARSCRATISAPPVRRGGGRHPPPPRAGAATARNRRNALLAGGSLTARRLVLFRRLAADRCSPSRCRRSRRARVR